MIVLFTAYLYSGDVLEVVVDVMMDLRMLFMMLVFQAEVLAWS